MIFLCPTEKLHSHVTKGFLATFPPEHSILSMNANINQVLNFSLQKISLCFSLLFIKICT